MRVVFLLFLCTFQSFSQSKTAKGFVYDEESKQPIPYVNISIIESSNGTSSDENGSFELTIDEADFNKQVHLSSLGYKDSIILVEKFIKQDKIFLKAKIEQLNEVVISKKFEDKFLVVNPINRKDIKSGFGSGANPWNLTLFFPWKDDYETKPYIKSVKVFLAKFNKKESRFRLRLFSVNDEGLPNDDLIFNNIIVETSKKQKEITIDISNYNIVFPKEGIFIGIEVLAIPFNQYEEVFNYNNSDGTKTKKKQIVYSPSIGAYYGKKDDFKTVFYTSGMWRELKVANFSTKDSFYVPAISLTLSN